MLPDSDFTVGVIGPGTGLGAAGLCSRSGSIFPIVGEGGHVGFAPESRVQMNVLAALRERFDRVSDERLVSGPGLENIYWALSQLHGEKSAALTAAEICRLAAEDGGSRASEALQLFFEILGQVAGNLALTLGATSGIYIAGGIARRYPDLLANSRFRSAFEAKGRRRSLMERIPTQLILYPEPGLLGAAYCARQIAGKNARRGK
ncbi:MAG: glucokinase [Woeseiaceae bacterium]